MGGRGSRHKRGAGPGLRGWRAVRGLSPFLEREEQYMVVLQHEFYEALLVNNSTVVYR